MARGRKGRRRIRAAAAAASYHFPMAKAVPENPNHALEPQYVAPIEAFVPISPFPCYNCEFNFYDREELDEHNGDFHPTDKFGCGLCLNKFETKAAKKTHRTKIHGIGGIGAHQVA